MQNQPMSVQAGKAYNKGILVLLSVVLLMMAAAAPASGEEQAASSEAEQVRFSMSELQRVDQQLYELVAPQHGFAGVHAWSVRPDRNRVVAYVESADRARTELAQANVDVERLVFEESGGELVYQPLVCTRSLCIDEPMRGGLSWFSRVGACTTGFGATRNGQPGFISAGHCAMRGDTAFVGRPDFLVEYGTVTSSVLTSTTDGLFAQKGADYPQPSRGFVYVSSAEPARRITSREPASGFRVGSRSCLSGQFSGFRCGTIEDASFTAPELGLRDVVLTDTGLCGVPGDSGAPVFNNSTAMGIFSGILVNSLDPFQRCQNGVYSKLTNVERGTGARIILE